MCERVTPKGWDHPVRHRNGELPREAEIIENSEIEPVREFNWSRLDRLSNLKHALCQIQNWRCGVCAWPERFLSTGPGMADLVLDEDALTGHIRGLLCRGCASMARAHERARQEHSLERELACESAWGGLHRAWTRWWNNPAARELSLPVPGSARYWSEASERAALAQVHDELAELAGQLELNAVE